MDFANFLIYGIVAVIIFTLLRYTMTAQSVMGTALKKPRIQIIEPHEFPPYLDAFFKEREWDLLQLGFQHIYSMMTENIYVKSIREKYYFVYYNDDEKCYAYLTTSDKATQNSALQVHFESRYAGGKRFVALNGMQHTILGTLPNTVIEDPYSTDLKEHFDYFLRKRDAYSKEQPLPYLSNTPHDEIIKEETEYFQAYFDNLLKKGIIYPDAQQDDVYLIKTFPAIAFVHRILKGTKLEMQLFAHKFHESRRRVEVPDSNYPLETDVINYQNTIGALNRPSKNVAGKTLFMGVSLLLFIIAFGFFFGIKLMVTVLGVVILHEGGHLLAMRIMGYKNLSMLFIPLVGAVAIGSDRGIPAYKRLVAYFAGPLPGIFIAFLLVLEHQFNIIGLGLQSHPIITDIIMMLLVINYFNLLPIMPLDGGHVFNTIIFSRFDWLQPIFNILSFVGMVILALALQAPILFFISLFSLMGFRQYMAQKKIMDDVRLLMKNAPGLSETGVIRKIFLAMRKAPYNRLIFQNKVRMAQSVENVIHTPKASILTIIVTFIFYCFIMTAPIFYLVFSAVITGKLPFSDKPIERYREEAKPQFIEYEMYIRRMDSNTCPDFPSPQYINSPVLNQTSSEMLPVK